MLATEKFYECIIEVAAKWGLEGLQPPNVLQRGQSPPKLYVCDVINIL